MNTWIINTLKIQYLAYFICIFNLALGAAPLNLKGEQDGSYPEGEYLITEDVNIPAGKIMTLDAGAILKFKPYTGLKISGKLFCKGSSLKSILFTSYNPSDTNKSSESSFIQWNGIEVDSGGAIDFDRVEITNSVYGIKADANNDSLVLKDVLFRNNTEDFKVGDSLIIVDYNSLYKGRFNASDLPDSASMIAGHKKRRKGKIALQVSLASIGVAGAVVAAVYHNKYSDASDDYYSSGGLKDYRIDADNFYTIRNVSGAVGASAFTGLILTFFF